MRGFLFIQVFIVKYTYMDNILNEINRSRKLMGLNESKVNEQAISAASKGVETGQKGTDEEYKLLGMVKWYLGHDVIGKQIKSGGLKPGGIPDFDAMKSSFDKRQDLMLESKRICRMGQILFEYLFENGSPYKEQQFKETMDVLNAIFEDTERWLVDDSEHRLPSDGELINQAKSTTEFRCN